MDLKHIFFVVYLYEHLRHVQVPLILSLIDILQTGFQLNDDDFVVSLVTEIQSQKIFFMKVKLIITSQTNKECKKDDHYLMHKRKMLYSQLLCMIKLNVVPCFRKYWWFEAWTRKAWVSNWYSSSNWCGSKSCCKNAD